MIPRLFSLAKSKPKPLYNAPDDVSHLSNHEIIDLHPDQVSKHIVDHYQKGDLSDSQHQALVRVTVVKDEFKNPKLSKNEKEGYRKSVSNTYKRKHAYESPEQAHLNKTLPVAPTHAITVLPKGGGRHKKTIKAAKRPGRGTKRGGGRRRMASTRTHSRPRTRTRRGGGRGQRVRTKRAHAHTSTNML